MEYKQFIDCIAEHQTPHIKPLYLPKSCAPQVVPEAFKELIADMVDILENNFETLCEGKSLLGVFGLQVATTMIQSDLPMATQRIFNRNHVSGHFCCTLDYLALMPEALTTTSHWQGSSTVLVDFTSGKVMDADQFIYEALQMGEPGKVYGQLDEGKLNLAWQKICLLETIN